MELNEAKLRNLREDTVRRLFRDARRLYDHQRARKGQDYTPLPHQKRFHESPARIRALIGSNRCGKTVAGMREALYYMRGNHPYRHIMAPNHGWIVALDNEVTKDVLFPKFLSMLKPGEAKKIDSRLLIVELDNGSVVKFKSCEAGREKFQSAENRWTWFDEEPPKDIWEECGIRIGTEDPLDMWITMTPLNGMDWSYDEIYNNQSPGELEVFEAVMDDNTFLPVSERDRMRKKYAASEDGEARLSGRYFSRSGLIYKQFNKDVHVIDPFPIPETWPWVLCVDPHPRKPSAAVWVAIGPSGEYYVADERNDDRDHLLSEFAAKVIEKSGERRIVRKLVDPAARAESSQTGKTNLDVLRENGLRGLRDANREVTYGWDAVRQRLAGENGVKLFFFRSCPKTIWQIEHLAYEEWRFRAGNRDVKETQRKKDDDLADCVRYICAERISGSPARHVFEAPPLPNQLPGRYSGYR